jgi:hypothetical protein
MPRCHEKITLSDSRPLVGNPPFPLLPSYPSLLSFHPSTSPFFALVLFFLERRRVYSPQHVIRPPCPVPLLLLLPSPIPCQHISPFPFLYPSSLLYYTMSYHIKPSSPLPVLPLHYSPVRYGIEEEAPEEDTVELILPDDVVRLCFCWSFLLLSLRLFVISWYRRSLLLKENRGGEDRRIDRLSGRKNQIV